MTDTTPAGMPQRTEFDYVRALEAGRTAALEEAAAMVEQLTYRRRLATRAVNGLPKVEGCEYAAAIRALIHEVSK